MVRVLETSLIFYCRFNGGLLLRRSQRVAGAGSAAPTYLGRRVAPMTPRLAVYGLDIARESAGIA